MATIMKNKLRSIKKGLLFWVGS